MTRDATPAGPGPDLPDRSEDLAHIRRLVESERVVGSEAEIDDALDELAALLLDTAESQGQIPTPIRAPIRPDARHARGPDPPPLGAVGT